MGKICILGEGLGVHVELGGLEMFGSYDDFVLAGGEWGFGYL